jgi:tight adherence protein C
MNLGILMAIAIFIAITLLTYGIMLFYRSRQVIKDRFKEPDNPAMTLLRRDEGQSNLKKRILHWLSLPGKLALKNQEEVSQIRSSLIMAGYRQANAPAVYYGLRAVFALSLPLPYLLMIIVQKNITPTNLFISFALSAVGYFVPQYLLRMNISGRQDRLDRALPDVLDLFIVCMEAGLALQAAMNRVADEIKGAYRDFYSELQLTAAELRAGIPQEVALKNFSARTGVPSINSLVTLMIQTEKLGTSIAQSLRTHADFVRVQRALRAEEKAAKTPIKILIPLVFFIFPAMFVVVAGPAAIQVVKTIFPALKH